ncbi:EboA domain-containing protein [Streptomyces sp. NPDC057238]|uniref:EboA domain-containing protein n=1 Tax=Streptomyces sp. NPDC057238 TaxID=3346060 RepID=UPI003643B972
MTRPHVTPATPEADTTGGPATPGDGTTPALTPPAELRRRLADRLGGAARAWLDQALDEAATHPGTHGPISVWELRLAEAGRRCGPAHADAARVLILHAAHADADALTRVYFQGTADERRAVLHALPHLVPDGPGALPLVEDALRTNDTRLVAAALGPYAARHLDAHAWRHAVLKCLFTGVGLDHVADLARRARSDGELARMLGDYAAERTAAGRAVPEDLHRVLALTESAPATPPHGTDDPHGKES